MKTLVYLRASFYNRDMKAVNHLVSAILFAAILALAPGIIRDSLADQQAKSDIAEINHAKYGLFSVNAWKARITGILIGEVQNFDLKITASKLKATIEDELTTVIDKLNEQLRESNEKTLGGRLRQALFDLLINMKAIKAGVPKYADAMIEQLGKPETQEKIKSVATKQLKTYLKRSYTEENLDPVYAVLDKTGTDSIEDATQKLNDQIGAHADSLKLRCYAIIGLALLLFAWAAFRRNRTPFSVSMLFGSLTVLLVIGITIPMIDLHAKISELSFVLLGHRIAFENQILYFQSKSVFNVFWLMITHADLKMKAVGILVVMFSTIFPTLKMAASITYYYFERTRKSKIIQIFAFKVGKWSMADVMVVAIFMSYIGFNGIVESQLKKMGGVVHNSDVAFFTTNETSLQMGYYIFLTYVLLAMVLSSYVHSSAPVSGEPA